jgi:hypothetical protein
MGASLALEDAPFRTPSSGLEPQPVHGPREGEAPQAPRPNQRTQCLPTHPPGRYHCVAPQFVNSVGP